MIQESFSDKVFVAVNKVFVLFMVLIILYPLIYVLTASVSDPNQVNAGNIWLLPKGLTFEGYQRVFQNQEIWIGYRNTIFYTVVATLINLMVTLPCAYALSRNGLTGKKLVMALLVFTMFFNGGLIPSYLLIRDLGMLDTVFALLIPSAASVWNIIVTRTFFQMSVPSELVEAAEIDGCSNTVLFIRLVLPISTPIIAVMALFYGVFHWNQYFSAMIFLSDRNIFPLQLFLREILVQNQMTEAMMLTDLDTVESIQSQARIADILKYALMIVASLPLLMIYPFLQRYFVKGVLIGSLKG